MNLPTTSYAVMGLLSTSSMSGYQLSRFVAESIAHFWTISKSQVYGELARLEELGFVEGTDVSQDKRPDKRTYELTPAGAEALDAWLAEPTYEPERVRVGFLVKVFFGHRMTSEQLLELLARCRDEAEANRKQMEQIADVLSENPQTAFMRATALLGLRGAEATLQWCDEVEPLFRKRSRRRAGR